MSSEMAIHLVAIGDSKTAGEPQNNTDWKSKLVTLYSNVNVPATFEGKDYAGNGGPNCFCQPGWTTQNAKDQVDTWMASAPAKVDYVLYTLGTNDGASPNETTWKANTAYIWDAFLAKYPNVKIKVTQPPLGAGGDLIAQWETDLEATRPRVTFAFDERTFLTCPTYLSDCAGSAVHENAAGADLVSQHWFDAINWLTIARQ